MTSLALHAANSASKHQRDARFWDRIARKYAAGAIADQAGYERSLSRTRDFLSPDTDVLEIGCGTGSTALNQAPYARHITATDISPEMITIAREKIADNGPLNVDFTVAHAASLPFAPQSFDVVMAHSILHLVDDLDETLHAAHTMLRPGGVLIAKTPCLLDMNPLIPYVALPVMKLIGKAPSVLCFTGDELRRSITANGFTIIADEMHGTKGRDTRPFIVARKV